LLHAARSRASHTTRTVARTRDALGWTPGRFISVSSQQWMRGATERWLRAMPRQQRICDLLAARGRPSRPLRGSGRVPRARSSHRDPSARGRADIRVAQSHSAEPRTNVHFGRSEHCRRPFEREKTPQCRYRTATKSTPIDRVGWSRCRFGSRGGIRVANLPTKPGFVDIWHLEPVGPPSPCRSVRPEGRTLQPPGIVVNRRVESLGQRLL
jgi:hypothetical protein